MFDNLALKEFYEKRAPRWFKVIKWRQKVARMKEAGYWNFVFIAPFVVYPLLLDPYLVALYFKRPKTEEERLKLKRYYDDNEFQRNWEMDQYRLQMPPRYDLWERRRAYPQYYEGRYENFSRDHTGVVSKDYYKYS